MPQPGAARDVSFPEMGEAQLSNGLTVLALEDRYLPRVSVSLTLPAGKVSNPEDNWALANLSAALLKEGTTHQDSDRIAQRIDQAAIDFHTTVLMEASTLSMAVLKHQLPVALELLSEMALEPIFPEEEVERYKIRWTSQLAARRADASYLASERAYRECFPKHPYARNHFRDQDLVRANRNEIFEYWKSYLIPSRSLLGFAGDCSLEEATGLAQEYFGDWDSQSDPSIKYPFLDELNRRVVIVERPGSVQSQLVIASHSVRRGNPDYDALRLANQVFGGGGSARLFLNLREEKGLTYGAYSTLRAYRKSGLLLASASLQASAGGQAAKEILQEMENLASREPHQDELRRTKAEQIGRFYRSMETPGAILGMEVSRRVRGLPSDHHRTLVRRIQALTGQQVKQAWARHIQPFRTIIVAVGDGPDLETSLAPLGPVEIYDAVGDRVE